MAVWRILVLLLPWTCMFYDLSFLSCFSLKQCKEDHFIWCTMLKVTSNFPMMFLYDGCRFSLCLCYETLAVGPSFWNDTWDGASARAIISQVATTLPPVTMLSCSHRVTQWLPLRTESSKGGGMVGGGGTQTPSPFLTVLYILTSTTWCALTICIHLMGHVSRAFMFLLLRHSVYLSWTLIFAINLNNTPVIF